MDQIFFFNFFLIRLITRGNKVNKCTNYMVTYMGISPSQVRERERGEEATFNLGNNQKIALEESLI